MKKITGIMACDPQGVIAKNGKLPWYYPADENFFLGTTTGQVNIMGEETFRTGPTTFSDFVSTRFNIVFSYTYKNDDTLPNVRFVSSIEECLKLINSAQMPEDKKYYMVGGAQIANLFLEYKLLDDFLLTMIKRNYEGDTYLTAKDIIQKWPYEVVEDNKDYAIRHYTNPESLYKTLSKE